MKLLVTCRQMQESLPALTSEFEGELRGIEILEPRLEGQHFSAAEMADLLHDVDAAIIGDDHVDDAALANAEHLKILCKWGIGVDGIDLLAASRLGIATERTPNMFGDEVADVAFSYAVMLVRDLAGVDHAVRQGHWLKPRGHSLSSLEAAVVGMGDVGRALVRRLIAAHVSTIGIDPDPSPEAESLCPVFDHLPAGSLPNLIFVTCPLTPATRGLIDRDVISRMARPSYIINVARGPVVAQDDLIEALETGTLAGAALDVFETEPLPVSSPLTKSNNVLLGSHNASNTVEASLRASREALLRVLDALGRS